MVQNGTTAARRELLDQVRDVVKAVRLFKNQLPPAQAGVPSGTFGVLATIAKIESRAGCHGKDLAAECALDPSTISRAVAALVRAGLVVRTADPADGRASVLGLTPLGHRTLNDVVRWYDDLLADALQNWTARDLTDLAGMLHRFSDDVIAHIQDRPGGPADDPTKILEAAR